MKLFPRDKHRIDFLALASRKESNPWISRFYFLVGIVFFAYVFYELIAGRL